MKVTNVVILASVFLGYGVTAYAQADPQASASANSSTSVKADRSGAPASAEHSANASRRENSASLASGTALHARLSQPLDAGKNHPGDKLFAKTTAASKSAGRVVIPQNTQLIGHVTQAKARTKGQTESALGIVFDMAILKDGTEIPLSATVQALAVAQSEASSNPYGDDLAAESRAGATGSGQAASGALGGVGAVTGSAAGAATNSAGNLGRAASGGPVNSAAKVASASEGAVGGLDAAGQLRSNSQGVFGLQGLRLNSSEANSTEGSLITSTSRNAHLDSGTQMVLVAHGQASTQQ